MLETHHSWIQCYIPEEQNPQTASVWCYILLNVSEASYN